MEILPVPEDPLEESCSSLSSFGGPKESAPHSLSSSRPSRKSTGGHSELTRWRNLIFGFLMGSALVLAVATYVSFTKWEDSNVLPALFAVMIVLAFCNVTILFYFYDQQVHQLRKQTLDGSTADYLGLSEKPAIQYAMSNEDSVTGSNRGSDIGIGVRKVTSLLTNSFRPFRNPNNLHSKKDATDPNQMMLNGMASTESLNQFLGAVKRDNTFLSNNDGSGRLHTSQPAAEFFAETTVLYADISGFTAWSSVREPSQVFTLLETLFHAYDSIAHRRKVFKVETVGDCYVAVTGLPKPTKEHAVIMAYFARDCMRKMDFLCKKLETTLGPDTSDLKLRIGIHSGAVTGGVLRGKRSRFQLFGDTVNTAARVEALGEGGKIHLSETTAQLLEKAGKSHWMTKREQRLVFKGKAAMQTYYLQVQPADDDVPDIAGSGSFDDDSEFSMENTTVPVFEVCNTPKNGNGIIESVKATSKALGNKLSSAKTERLVSWNVELLLRILKQIVARRQLILRDDPTRKTDADESIYMTREDTLLEEVKESIDIPIDYCGKEAMEHAKTIHLDPVVEHQLQDYVRKVAQSYPNHPFHNFEHASHVTMSVAKLLSRIVAPSANEFQASEEQGQSLHDHTYGITSDPLTQFACVLSALIHDADHPGVPNAQLVKEETKEAKKYKGKSVAEQNSLDWCWELLMEPKYDELRRTIYTTSAGLARFRSLLVNSVMATDICDPDLKNLRNGRWDRAFNKEGNSEPESEKAAKDRKATIVIEHLIQASDVSHTMQHWHVYRRWNERLFRECYKAYKEGRAAKDPAEFWYQGEKGFFDFYIIPLAKKLKECGVFGVSSSEYLDYAISNRAEWEEKGEQAVKEMIANVKLIEQQARLKQQMPQKKQPSQDDRVSNTNSSGFISFDSNASIGELFEDKC